MATQVCVVFKSSFSIAIERYECKTYIAQLEFTPRVFMVGYLIG